MEVVPTCVCLMLMYSYCLDQLTVIVNMFHSYREQLNWLKFIFDIRDLQRYYEDIVEHVQSMQKKKSIFGQTQ